MEASIAILVVTALTEVIKRAFNLNTRYAPAISLLLGVGIMFLSNFPIKETLTVGIIVGLSASGLYGGMKKTIKG